LFGSLAAQLPCPSQALGQERTPRASVHWVSTGELPDGLIAGLVVDAKTGEPIEGATVRLEGTKIGALTDSVGRFRFDAPNANAPDLVLVFERIGYDSVREAVRHGAGAGIAIQASLKEAERVVCGQVYCSGYGCDGGVKLIVTSLLGELPAGTPITLVASVGSVADTAVLKVEDRDPVYLAAGEDLGIDGPFTATVSAPGFSIWQASDIWLYSHPCSEKKASPWIRVWLLPPGAGDTLSNKR
jgi:hypothetical protein